MDITSLILIGFAVLVGLWVVLMYNGLVAVKNRAEESFSDIDVQLKRRYNLIPNLVETVKGYAAHERQVFERVTQARSQAMQAKGVGEKAQAENMLSETLKSLFAVAENYPDLKASVNFLELQRELRDTEDKIQAARRFYNTMVMELNTKIESFPTNLMAGVLGFKKRDFFEIEEATQRQVPGVQF